MLQQVLDKEPTPKLAIDENSLCTHSKECSCCSESMMTSQTELADILVCANEQCSNYWKNDGSTVELNLK